MGGVGSVDVTGTGVAIGSGGRIVSDVGYLLSAISISHSCGSPLCLSDLKMKTNRREDEQKKKKGEDGLEGMQGWWWIEEVSQQTGCKGHWLFVYLRRFDTPFSSFEDAEKRRQMDLAFGMQRSAYYVDG